MNSAVQELQADLKSFPKLFISPSNSESEIPENKKIEPAASRTKGTLPLMEIIPLVTSASLLIEISIRINGIVDAVDELADSANFVPASINDTCQQNDAEWPFFTRSTET